MGLLTTARKVDAEVEWRPVVGYEGRYEVSSDGRVRTWLPPNGRGPWPTSPRERRPGGGIYLSVPLCDGHNIRTRTVHTLVADAFLGPKPVGCEVRHLDGNPHNNSASNLAWGTRAENMQDMIGHGRTNRGERFYGTHLTDLDVVHIRQLAGAGMPHREIGSMYGMGREGVGKIVRRERWSHVA